MMHSFATLEADDTRQNLARATAVLAEDLSTLDHTTEALERHLPKNVKAHRGGLELEKP